MHVVPPLKLNLTRTYKTVPIKSSPLVDSIV